MPTFLPFKAIRPPRDKAHLVASRSYISYNKYELSDKLSGNPYTFLHLINPEASLGLRRTKNTSNRFKLVSKRFEDWCNNGYFISDDKNAFYVYKQTQEDKSFVGIIGCTAVSDYAEGKIKIHEQTITAREDIFKDYLDYTNFHAEPVLLTYPESKDINEIVADLCKKRSDFDFSTTDKIRHQLWVINDKKTCSKIAEHLEAVPDFYIADGHHRSASSLRLAEKRNADNPGQKGKMAYNYFMSCLIPDTQLHISPFHRLIHDLNGLTPEDILRELSKSFCIDPLTSGEQAKPANALEYGMCILGSWYKLTLLNFEESENPIQNLNTQLLTERILSPIFNIIDLKTDKRISCIDGTQGHKSIEKAIGGKGAQLGFWLYPISVNQVKEIADLSLIMPPKSTWVEPKLRSGLTVYSLAGTI